MSIGIIGWIVIGLLAGWIASMLTNRHHGLILNLAIGLVGAVLGGWLAGLFGFHAYTHLGTFVVALVGAVVLLMLLGLVNRPRI